MLFIEAPEENRADVALSQPAAAHELNRSLAKIIDRPGMIHPIDFGGIQKSLHVFTQTKDSGPAFGRVTSDSFEDTRTIVQNVRHHVHARIIPFDEPAVMPYFIANARSGNVFRFAAGWKHVLILLWRLKCETAYFRAIDKARYSSFAAVCKMKCRCLDGCNLKSKLKDPAACFCRRRYVRLNFASS